MKTCILHFIFMLAVSLANTNDWRKYQKLEMSKKENVAGRLGWQVRLKLFVRDFSDLQPREVITILTILFGKSLSRFSRNRSDDKADSAQNKQTTFLPKRESA